MTIKQIYLLSAVLLCTLACSFGCHASEPNERNSFIDSWKATLGQLVPALAQPENSSVLAFLCEMRFEGQVSNIDVRDIFNKTLGQNSEHVALLKELPHIMLDALQAHQNMVAQFRDYAYTLRKIKVCMPQLPLSMLDQLLHTTGATRNCQACSSNQDTYTARYPIYYPSIMLSIPEHK